MNMKIIKKAYLCIFFSTCLVSGCDSNKPIKPFVENRAVLASGINFETGELVAVHADTGLEIPPCVQKGGTRQGYPYVEEIMENGAPDMKNGMQKCNTEFVIDDNPALNSALELSRKPINGKIRKNGKLIDAGYFVIVKALYQGSHCNTDGSGGDQFEGCGRD